MLSCLAGSVLFCAAFGGAAAATPPDDLAQQMKDLAAKLGQVPVDDTLKAALDALYQAAGDSECNVSPTADSCLSHLKNAVRKLNGVISGAIPKGSSPVSLTDDQVKAIETQITTLAAAVASGKPSAPAGAADAAAKAPAAAQPPAPNAATATAIEIASLLTTQLKVKDVDATNQDLVKALNGLVKTKVSTPPATPAPVINVLGAYFGDVQAIEMALANGTVRYVDSSDPSRVDFAAQESRRFCSATRTMRTFCQGQPSCFDTTSGTDKSSTHVVGSEMCGYDPVPYAEAKIKGLLVFFECLTTTVADVALYDNWPTAYNQERPPRSALLRAGETSGIYCSQSTSSAAKNGQAKGTSNTPNTATSAAPVTIITGGGPYTLTVPAAGTATPAPQAAATPTPAGPGTTPTPGTGP
jgi:hypothetical protein